MWRSTSSATAPAPTPTRATARAVEATKVYGEGATAVAAAHADAVVFLAAGRIVDETAEPRAARTVDPIEHLGSRPCGRRP
jgi:hypothetical protein